MSKAKADPNRKMGKFTGYEVRDGKYFLAPTYRQEMDALMARERGIESVLRAVTAFANEELARIEAERMARWKRTKEDLALDMSTGVWQYDYLQGCIYQVQPKPSQAAGQDQKGVSQ